MSCAVRNATKQLAAGDVVNGRRGGILRHLGHATWNCSRFLIMDRPWSRLTVVSDGPTERARQQRKVCHGISRQSPRRSQQGKTETGTRHLEIHTTNTEQREPGVVVVVVVCHDRI